MRPVIAAVALFALASTAFAADVKLGPETPLSAPAIDAAAGDQIKASFAWYGDSLAVAWVDVRNGYPGVRIAQLDERGKPKGIAARAYGSVTETRLASSGAATPVLATELYGSTYAGPAGTSGNGFPGRLSDLVTDGNTYLLVTLDDHVNTSVLDARGEVISSATFGTTYGIGHAVAVPFAGAYHVISTQLDCGVGCTPALHDTIIQSDGSISDQTIVSPLPGPIFAAAATRDRLLIAMQTESAIDVLILDASRMLAAHTSIDAQAQQLYAGSDGTKFLLGWNDGTALRAVRMNDLGTQEGQPFTLGSKWGRDLSVARTPAGVVAGWSDGLPANVFTRGANNLDAIAAAPNVLASIGYTQQRDLSLHGVPVWIEGEANPRHRPRAARGAGSTLTAWLEGTSLVAAFNDGAPFTIADHVVDHDVAFDGASFFVVWSDGRLHTMRFTTSGAKLETAEIPSNGNVTSLSAMRVGESLAIAFADGNDIVYAAGTQRIIATDLHPSRPAIAADDHDQPFVVWASGEKPCVIGAHRIAGSLFGVAPVVCTESSPRDPDVAWSGSEFVIAWDEFDMLILYRTIRALRAGRNGNAIDGKPFNLTGVFRDAYGASVLPSPEGVTIGYQRVAVEEPFDDVSRVFIRTLARLGGVPPRGRVIGR